MKCTHSHDLMFQVLVLRMVGWESIHRIHTLSWPQASSVFLGEFFQKELSAFSQAFKKSPIYLSFWRSNYVGQSLSLPTFGRLSSHACWKGMSGTVTAPALLQAVVHMARAAGLFAAFSLQSPKEEPTLVYTACTLVCGAASHSRTSLTWELGRNASSQSYSHLLNQKLRCGAQDFSQCPK